MSTNTCGIRHKSSSTTVAYSFAERRISTNSVVQATRCFCYTADWHRIHLTFVGSSPSADTCDAYLDVLLVFLRLAINCFRAGAFSGSPPVGRLTVFSLSVDLKEAATLSSVLYNMAEVVHQGRHRCTTRTVTSAPTI